MTIDKMLWRNREERKELARRLRSPSLGTSWGVQVRLLRFRPVYLQRLRPDRLATKCTIGV